MDWEVSPWINDYSDYGRLIDQCADYHSSVIADNDATTGWPLIRSGCGFTAGFGHCHWSPISCSGVDRVLILRAGVEKRGALTVLGYRTALRVVTHAAKFGGRSLANQYARCWCEPQSERYGQSQPLGLDCGDWSADRTERCCISRWGHSGALALPTPTALSC